MELYYKCTTWCKLKFPNETITKEEMIKQLNEGTLPLDIAYSNPNFDVEWEVINETEEFLPVVENNGKSTIELKINDKTIWNNSFQFELKNVSS